MRRDRRRRIVVLVVGLIVAIAMVSPFLLPLLAHGAVPSVPDLSSTAEPARAAGPAPAASAESRAQWGHADQEVQEQSDRPLVVLGTGGLTWADITPEATPNIWGLTADGLTANLVVRSVFPSTCRTDGWLGLSAGRRALGERDDTGACLPPQEVGAADEPSSAGGVPRWAAYVEAAESDRFDAAPGTLGELLEEAGRRTVAVGPGAAIALAMPDGSVPDARPAPTSDAELASTVASAVGDGADLVVVDLDPPQAAGRVGPGPDRVFTAAASPTADAGTGEPPTPITSAGSTPDQAWAEESGRNPASGPTPQDPGRNPASGLTPEELDARVGAVLDALGEAGERPAVLLASLYDGTRTSTLQALVLTPEEASPGLATSSSTRTDGMVQTPDLLPTVLAHLDVDVPGDLPGSPLMWDQVRIDATARADRLADTLTRAHAVRPLVSPAVLVLVGANIALGALALLGLNRRFLTLLGSGATARRRVLRGLGAAALVVGSVPVALIAVGLVPWWRASSPGWAFTAAVTAGALLLAVVAALGPWRHRMAGPIAVVWLATAGVIAWDVCTGSDLFLGSVLGTQPHLGARYYGMSNHYFTLFSTAMLLLAAGVAQVLVRRGRPRPAALAVLALGVVTAVVDGLPSLGADFGGPPAILPAFAVLALMVARLRVTWGRVVAIGAGTVVAVGAVAAADWLRPPSERTHLGRFVQTVLDGGAADVVIRKLSRNLEILVSSPLTLLTAVGGIVVVVLVVRPLRRPATAETSDYGWLVRRSATGETLAQAATVLRPAAVGLAVLWVIGFAVNDSGIVIPALGIALALPTVLALLSTWLRERPSVQPAEPVAA